MNLIVGGGVVGLSLGLNLLRKGEKVTILEQHDIGGGASWAAAGYLEPTLLDTPISEIEWQSLNIWPNFVKEIEEISGRDVDYQTHGQLKIAYPENEAEILADIEARKNNKWQVELISADQLLKFEPNLSEEIVCAAYLPQVSWVDGRKLCKALAIAITNLGGKVLKNTSVERLLVENDAVIGVATPTEKFHADRVILAAGYKSGKIADLPQDLPQSYGQKGVILTLKNTSGSPILRHLIKRPNGIICPRNDGRILVGVTRDDDNFSPGAEAGSVLSLLQNGIRAMPMLAELPLLETNVGFRPFVRETPDSVIGQSKLVQNLHYSLGHGSDGYLRAPYFSNLLADQILNGADPA